jgi:hypothetical protein
VPYYQYNCECGEEIDRYCSLDNIKRKVKCPKCGKMAPKAVICPNAIVRHRLTEPARKGRGRGF